MLELLFTLVSIVTGFGTGIAMTATHLGIPYLSGNAAYYISLLVAYGFIFGVVYVLSNVLDAVTPQTNRALYRLSFVSSWFAAILLTFDSAVVLFHLLSDGHLSQLRNIPGSLQLLFGLTLFSWFDVGYLQHRKYASLMATRGAPPALTISPARTDHWGWATAIVLVLALTAVVVMFAVGVKIPDGLAFRNNTTPPPVVQQAPPQKEAPPVQTQVPPPAQQTPPAQTQVPGKGMKVDIEGPLGPQWKDVTKRY